MDKVQLKGQDIGETKQHQTETKQHHIKHQS